MAFLFLRGSNYLSDDEASEDEVDFRLASAVLAGIVFAVYLLLQCGIEVTPHETGLRVGYSWWAIIAWFVGGSLGLIGAWKLRDRFPEVGYGTLIFLPFVLLFALPTVCCNGIVVDDEGFRVLVWRFVWLGDDRVAFAQTSQMTLRTVHERSGERQYLRCQLPNSKRLEFPVRGMITEALPHILRQAHTKGIPVDTSG